MPFPFKIFIFLNGKVAIKEALVTSTEEKFASEKKNRSVCSNDKIMAKLIHETGIFPSCLLAVFHTSKYPARKISVDGDSN